MEGSLNLEFSDGSSGIYKSFQRTQNWRLFALILDGRWLLTKSLAIQTEIISKGVCNSG